MKHKYSTLSFPGYQFISVQFSSAAQGYPMRIWMDRDSNMAKMPVVRLMRQRMNFSLLFTCQHQWLTGLMRCGGEWKKNTIWEIT